MEEPGLGIGKNRYPRDQETGHFEAPYRPEDHVADGTTAAALKNGNKPSLSDKLLSTPGSVAAPDSPTTPVSYVDTCMHLDQAFSRLPPEESYASLRSHFPTHFDSLVNVTLRPNKFPESIALADEHEDVYNMFGVHPFYSDGYTDELGDQLKTDFLSHPKTVACGVIGLDFSSRFSPAVIELQKKAFTYQLNYAVIAKKPVAVYNRFADADTLQILKQELPTSWPLVLCNYMGSPTFLSDIWSHFSFAFVGVNGVITHNTPTGRVLQDIVRKAPLDRLLLESNGPYMIPDPHRDQGHICHSGYVPMVAQKIADLKGINVVEVYRQTRINTREAYGIPEKSERQGNNSGSSRA